MRPICSPFTHKQLCNSTAATTTTTAVEAAFCCTTGGLPIRKRPSFPFFLFRPLASQPRFLRFLVFSQSSFAFKHIFFLCWYFRVFLCRVLFVLFFGHLWVPKLLFPQKKRKKCRHASILTSIPTLQQPLLCCRNNNITQQSTPIKCKRSGCVR